MNDRLKLRHVETFVAVFEERHVGKAATRLKLTQPALSKTLAELDDIAGARLIDRSRSGVSLTRRGEDFLPHAVAALSAFERAAAIAMQGPTRSLADVVRVGALPSVAPDLLPAALGRFSTRRPNASVTVLTAANATLLHWLTTGVVDIVLGRMSDPSSMAGLTFEWLYVEPLVVVARPGHPLIAEPEITMARLLSFPVVVATPGTLPRHNTESFLLSRGALLPPNRLETLSVTVARLVVQRSKAVWFASAGAVREDCHRGGLAILPINTAGTEEPVGLLCRRDGTRDAATEDFMATLRDRAAARV